MTTKLRLLCTLLLSAWGCFAQDPLEQVRAQLARIEQGLRDKPIAAADAPNFAQQSAGLFQSVHEALDSHRLYLSLERLAQLWSVVQATRSSAEHSAQIASKATTFDAELASASGKTESAKREIGANRWGNAPLAMRALIEAARGRMDPLLSGGRGFAATGDTSSGLFYLGQAEAQAEFAQFCISLNLTRNVKPPAARSMLPELLKLQERTNAAFVPPRSIDQHPQFITLNALLKAGRELDEEKSYTGALYRYLDATQAFALLDIAEVDAENQAATKAKLASLRRGLNPVKRDDSLAELFLDRADSFVANGGKDQWRSAAAIADQVIPTYFATRTAPAVSKQTSRKTVDLTLVRWPFT